MNELKKYLPSSEECKEFTLFLDRDGVLNEPIIDDYAKRPGDFIFCKGALGALARLQVLFKRIIIVTNQQGVDREVMSESDLEDVHLKMYNAMKSSKIPYFDSVFFAPYLKNVNHNWRKPSNGMYEKSLEYFKDIEWEKCIMVGDSPGDMHLADTKNIIKVKILNSQFDFDNQDFSFKNLSAFVDCLS